jgi:hypothetical protein
MRPARPLLTATVAAALSLTVACGGSDGTTSTASTTAEGPLTADVFRAQANAICQTAAAQLTSLTEPTTPEEFEPFFNRYTETTRTFVINLAALDPPAELEADVNAYLELQRKVVSTSEGAIDGMKGGRSPEEAFGAVSQDLTTFETQSSAIATRLGLDQCVDPELVTPATTS